MPRDPERPLSPREQKFIRNYCRPDVRDLEMSAQLAGLKPSDGKRLYNDVRVREEIDRRLRLVELEQAKLDAEAEILTDSLIDRALAETIGVDAKLFGSTKLNAIRLALVVKGRIETRNEKSVTAQAQPSAFRPTIYGAIAQGGTALPAQSIPTTTTHRRIEEVTQTHAEPLPAPTAHVFEVIER